MVEPGITSVVEGFLRSHGWPVEGPDDSGTITTAAQGLHARFECLAAVEDDACLFTFYVYSPTMVPLEQRARAAEFLTRANYCMRIGNFEMDFSDGEVRFKTQALSIGSSLSQDTVSAVVNHGVGVMDHYYGALMEMIYGGSTPAAVIEEVESS